MCLPIIFEITIPADEPVRLHSAVPEELDCRKITAIYWPVGYTPVCPKDCLLLFYKEMMRKQIPVILPLPFTESTTHLVVELAWGADLRSA